MKLTLALTALLATTAWAIPLDVRHEDDPYEDAYRRRAVTASGIVPVKEEDIVSLGDRAVTASGIVPVKEEDIVSLGDRAVTASGIVPVKEEDIVSLGDRST